MSQAAARSFFDELDSRFEAQASAFDCAAQLEDNGTWQCPIAGGDHCDFECFYRLERLT